jgi:hypothetical protein
MSNAGARGLYLRRILAYYIIVIPIAPMHPQQPPNWNNPERPDALKAPELPPDVLRGLENARIRYVKFCADFEHDYLSLVPEEKRGGIEDAAESAAESAELEADDGELMIDLQNAYRTYVSEGRTPRVSGIADYVRMLKLKAEDPAEDTPEARMEAEKDATEADVYESQEFFMSGVLVSLGIPAEQLENNRKWLLPLYWRELSWLSYMEEKTEAAENAGADFREILDRRYFDRHLGDSRIPDSENSERQSLVEGWIIDTLVIEDRKKYLEAMITQGIGDSWIAEEFHVIEDFEKNPGMKHAMIGVLKKTYKDGGIEAAHLKFADILTQEADRLAERKRQEAQERTERGIEVNTRSTEGQEKLKNLRKELEEGATRWGRTKQNARKIGRKIGL